VQGRQTGARAEQIEECVALAAPALFVRRVVEFDYQPWASGKSVAQQEIGVLRPVAGLFQMEAQAAPQQLAVIYDQHVFAQ